MAGAMRFPMQSAGQNGPTEMGCFLLSELAELRLPYGLTIERDIYHTPMTRDEIFNM